MDKTCIKKAIIHNLHTNYRITKDCRIKRLPKIIGLMITRLPDYRIINYKLNTDYNKDIASFHIQATELINQ